MISNYSLLEHSTGVILEMRRLLTICFIVACAGLMVGCIEELKPKVNLKPNVWLKSGPKNGETIYDDGVEFEWGISDFDDDIGKGKIFVRFDPDSVTWYNPDAESVETFVLTDRGQRIRGWMRWYRSTYRWSVRGLPDSIYTFQVRVEDGRGADSTLAVTFKVRFDKYPPIIDSIQGLPPGKLQPQFYQMNVTVYAHDRARTAGAETPVSQLEYQFTLRGPIGFKTIETEWSRNNRFSTAIDGQTYGGNYTFRCRVKDKAGNIVEAPPHNFAFQS